MKVHALKSRRLCRILSSHLKIWLTALALDHRIGEGESGDQTCYMTFQIINYMTEKYPFRTFRWQNERVCFLMLKYIFF